MSFWNKKSKPKPKQKEKPAPKAEIKKNVKETKPMSKHADHKPEADEKEDKKAPYESGDLAKEFPAAHEELNRSAVHVSDRVRNALERSKKAGASAADVAKINALSKKLNATLEEIDEIATASEKKAKKDAE